MSVIYNHGIVVSSYDLSLVWDSRVMCKWNCNDIIVSIFLCFLIFCSASFLSKASILEKTVSISMLLYPLGIKNVDFNSFNLNFSDAGLLQIRNSLNAIVYIMFLMVCFG